MERTIYITLYEKLKKVSTILNLLEQEGFNMKSTQGYITYTFNEDYTYIDSNKDEKIEDTLKKIDSIWKKHGKISIEIFRKDRGYHLSFLAPSIIIIGISNPILIKETKHTDYSFYVSEFIPVIDKLDKNSIKEIETHDIED